MIPTTSKKLKKIHEVRVTWTGWFNTGFFIEVFFPLSNRCYDHCKNVFFPFSYKQLSGKHIPSSKSCNLLVQTIIKKNGVKQIKTTEENLSRSCILCQLLRTKTLTSGSKHVKQFFFIFTTICLISAEWTWF